MWTLRITIHCIVNSTQARSGCIKKCILTFKPTLGLAICQEPNNNFCFFRASYILHSSKNHKWIQHLHRYEPSRLLVMTKPFKALSQPSNLKVTSSNLCLKMFNFLRVVLLALGVVAWAHKTQRYSLIGHFLFFTPTTQTPRSEFPITINDAWPLLLTGKCAKLSQLVTAED